MWETLLGGGLVLAGVVISQTLQWWLAHGNRKERRDRLLREKFEELCLSILKSNDEVQAVTKLAPVPASEAHAPSAPQRAHYLAVIYFPELRQATFEYSNAVQDFHSYLLGNCDPHNPMSLGAQLCRDKSYQDFQGRAVRKRAAVEDAIEKHAERYTRA